MHLEGRILFIVSYPIVSQRGGYFLYKKNNLINLQVGAIIVLV